MATTTTDSTVTAATNEPTTFFGFGDYSLGCDSTPTQPINELDEYLQQPLEKVDSALKWWSAQQREYPNLSRIVCTVPAQPRVQAMIVKMVDITGKRTTGDVGLEARGANVSVQSLEYRYTYST